MSIYNVLIIVKGWICTLRYDIEEIIVIITLPGTLFTGFCSTETIASAVTTPTGPYGL